MLMMGALVAAAPAAAQDLGRAVPVAASGLPATPPVDARRLGVDLARIQRQLVRVSVREERDGLNLRYAVDVFGIAPPLDLFPTARVDSNFFTSPAPYGAPTHRDFLNLNTPIQHRAPAADFGALFRWLSDRAKADTPATKR